jgi:hypothetical protein
MKRTSMALAALLAIAAAWLGWQRVSTTPVAAAQPVVIHKQAGHFEEKTFDPNAPPADMPRLGSGETAVCDSQFSSSASLAGESRHADATHATMTITHVDVTLEMNVTIWVPVNAAQRVIDHEQGHRQISDRYYESADKIADEIAATYIGRQVPIAGTDLNAAATKALGELASEFTAEYGRRLDPEPTQQLYDDITDHSRNDTEVKDAVAIAIKNAQMSAIPASHTEN